MTSTALTAAPQLYEPVFNPDTNTHEDKCPWVKNWRGTRECHRCFCNANVTFNTRAGWKSHICSSKHKEALKEYISEKDETRKLKRESIIAIDKLERSKNKLAKENAKLTEEIESVNKHATRQSAIIRNLKQDIDTKEDRNRKLKTKNRKQKDKLSESVDYLEIVEKKCSAQLTKISELEAYIIILEDKVSLQSPTPAPMLSSPPPAPFKKSQSDVDADEDDEEWHDLSDED